jgi:uncharacterized glyoxalase superfamily metalloenzyme YdcJ
MAMKHVPSDEIRMWFSHAMSNMYRAEVPQYGALTELVGEVNAASLAADAALQAQFRQPGESDRLGIERHGAIRLGTATELFHIRRVFAVMGMHPVGYYDLSVAGVPVHSTAFRPVTDVALHHNPFRVFTSLLRLELIEDPALRAEASRILAARHIFTPRTLELVATYEANGGLDASEAEEFVREALETFRWHGDATVDLGTYRQLHTAHALIADIVCFRGPHINHLTPRTLDIDSVHAAMSGRGMAPKAVIEGPPWRRCPILLRQTSFKALEESILFQDGQGSATAGTHKARFGEIEQRGVALTAKGRRLDDELLAAARADACVNTAGGNADDYDAALAGRFRAFPDDWTQLHAEGLAFFHYSPTDAGITTARATAVPTDVDALVTLGFLRIDPIIYEDFLPVSAAGIFQSNLDTDEQHNTLARGSREQFEQSLGAPVLDELDLYAQSQARSRQEALAQLDVEQCSKLKRPTC